MTVYVDDMRARFGPMIMCHMIADTEAELHAMAAKIGVARKWYQGDHYDTALSKRGLAIECGAVEITQRQCAFMVGNARAGWPMGAPQTCEVISRLRRLVWHGAKALVLDVTGLPDAEVEGIRAHVRGLQEGVDSYSTPPHGWTCFHCGETFYTEAGARLHFGSVDNTRPTCMGEARARQEAGSAVGATGKA